MRGSGRKTRRLRVQIPPPPRTGIPRRCLGILVPLRLCAHSPVATTAAHGRAFEARRQEPRTRAYPSHLLDMPVILTGFWETPQP